MAGDPNLNIEQELSDWLQNDVLPDLSPSETRELQQFTNDVQEQLQSLGDDATAAERAEAVREQLEQYPELQQRVEQQLQQPDTRQRLEQFLNEPDQLPGITDGRSERFR